LVTATPDILELILAVRTGDILGLELNPAQLLFEILD